MIQQFDLEQYFKNQTTTHHKQLLGAGLTLHAQQNNNMPNKHSCIASFA